jgi:molybdenum cofactor cytidylyltransferase
VVNEDWEAGLSSSIRVGLDAIDPAAHAALFVLADQPLINSKDVERILRAYYGSMRPIVVPTCRGQRGNPVLFDRHLFPALKDLRGDVGGRELVVRLEDEVLPVEMQSSDLFFDIDTPAAYEQFLRAHEGAQAEP